MKKLLFGMVLLALVIAVPNPTMAMGRVDVGVSIRGNSHTAPL